MVRQHAESKGACCYGGLEVDRVAVTHKEGRQARISDVGVDRSDEVSLEDRLRLEQVAGRGSLSHRGKIGRAA